MTGGDAFAGLEPGLVWERFAELTRIARPPKDEEAARNHVLAWTASRSLEAQVDAEGNVVVRVSASPDRAATPTVVLQSHLDMVCERNPGSPYDPLEGRINVVREGDWVRAEGTTLGADNGIGVAAAMAVADDPALEHGPLELLFTVSEEHGLDGAKALDPALVAGRLLINLDGTSDRALTVGCAGSVHTFVRLQLPRVPHHANHVVLDVGLSGAKGGHSGGDIVAGRVNAIKALGRILMRSFEQEPFRLARFDGGVSRNAIPREARAVVALEPDAEPAFHAAAEQELAALREQYAGFDADLALSVAHRAETEAATDLDTRRLLDLVAAIPTGVIAMSAELPGVVETSTSLTVATTEGEMHTLASMTRSSKARALDDVVGTIAAAARLADAEIAVVRSYPPWRPDRDSRLLGVSRATFERLFGAQPELAVVHGGLECAVIGGKLPGIEMISIGPEIAGLHAPGERLRISSTQRFYRLLGSILDDLSR